MSAASSTSDDERDLGDLRRFMRLRVRPVGDEQQPGEQEEVRDDRRAAVGDERQRDPGQRDDPQDRRRR